MSTFHTNIGDEFVDAQPRFPQGRVVAARSFRQLQDNDLMPMGAFKDHRMKDVPASYLDRLRDADWVERRYPAVADYIVRNAKAIDKELDMAERSSRW